MVTSRLSLLFKKSVVIVECQESLEERAVKEKRQSLTLQKFRIENNLSAYGTGGLRIKHGISGPETHILWLFLCFC